MIVWVVVKCVGASVVREVLIPGSGRLGVTLAGDLTIIGFAKVWYHSHTHLNVFTCVIHRYSLEHVINTCNAYI